MEIVGWETYDDEQYYANDTIHVIPVYGNVGEFYE